jgi:transposase
MNKKLKPVVFVQGKYNWNNQNTTQQIMLLNALKVTQDPKKLKEMIGVRTVAEVYRTLDKIAMRKEYHAALAEHGITFDYIVKNIKGEIDNAEKSSDRLSGLNMLLKSIGLDKYEETAIGGGSWEEALLAIKKEKEKKGEKETTLVEYEVIEPEMPEHIRKAKEKANEEAKGLYD